MQIMRAIIILIVGLSIGCSDKGLVDLFDSKSEDSDSGAYKLKLLLSDDFSARAIGKRNIRKYTKYIIVAAIALLIFAAYFKPR